eukprot:361026-Chlamydomonas_euryale.AAC.7
MGQPPSLSPASALAALALPVRQSSSSQPLRRPPHRCTKRWAGREGGKVGGAALSAGGYMSGHLGRDREGPRTAHARYGSEAGPLAVVGAAARRAAAAAHTAGIAHAYGFVDRGAEEGVQRGLACSHEAGMTLVWMASGGSQVQGRVERSWGGGQPLLPSTASDATWGSRRGRGWVERDGAQTRGCSGLLPRPWDVLGFVTLCALPGTCAVP